MIDHHPEEDMPSRKDGDETEAHTGVDMYIVAEGAVTISPRVATNNPFGIQSHAYVAHPGDVIGEVACVVDALAGIRTRASLPNGPGIDLPARTPTFGSSAAPTDRRGCSRSTRGTWSGC